MAELRNFVRCSVTPARERGGQHVGLMPTVIRCEIVDENGFVIAATEVNTGYHGRSQHQSRELAIETLELITCEYRSSAIRAAAPTNIEKE